jgi:hypothetical protein
MKFAHQLFEERPSVLMTCAVAAPGLEQPFTWLAHGAVCASGSNELLVQAVNFVSDYHVTFFQRRKQA